MGYLMGDHGIGAVYTQPSLRERPRIEDWWHAKVPVREMARVLKHSKSTIHHETHPANFDLIYGRWGDGTSSADRCAVSLLHFENEKGPGVMVINAKDRPIGTSSLVSQAPTRDEIVGTDLATHVFAIFDAVISQDKRLT
jgi:hypothetical protein